MKNDKPLRRGKSKIEPSGIAKALTPRDDDAKFAGPEPLFDREPASSNRTVLLSQSFVWYNMFYGKKDAKEFLISYLEYNGRVDDSKLLRKVSEGEFIPTYSWLARMCLRGLQLTENEQIMLNSEIARLTNTLEKRPVDPQKETIESSRPNVQEIMRERARKAGGEIEGFFDQFILDGAKTFGNLRVIDELTKKNVMPQHVGMLVDTWKRKQAEYEEVIAGTDRELVQAYSNFTKTQMKSCVKFCEQVLSDLNSYVSLKKASKVPRVRKPVPVEKIVKDLKYLKSFKDDKLDLTSLHPSKLHGCSEAYIYDTELRKLIYLVADEYVKTLSVKGTTILGFDAVKSQVKTVRKPAEILPQFMKLGKPAGRKFFEDIKTLGVTPKGRMNERMIILKAW